jgi:hypothetical protein
MVQDSHKVVLPFVRVGTCPTRNFAHLLLAPYRYEDQTISSSPPWRVARIVVEDSPTSVGIFPADQLHPTDYDLLGTVGYMSFSSIWCNFFHIPFPFARGI